MINIATDEEREAAEFSKQRLQVNNAADVHFEGKLLHQYSTQNRDNSKPRWTELRLWETRGGAWIAESVGCTERQGEADLRDVLVIERYGETVELPRGIIEDEDDWPSDMRVILKEDVEAIREVMDFFGWSTVAKAFAKAAGWEVVRRVD